MSATSTPAEVTPLTSASRKAGDDFLQSRPTQTVFPPAAATVVPYALPTVSTVSSVMLSPATPLMSYSLNMLLSGINSAPLLSPPPRL